jgi:hypothetical protein
MGKTLIHSDSTEYSRPILERSGLLKVVDDDAIPLQTMSSRRLITRESPGQRGERHLLEHRPHERGR